MKSEWNGIGPRTLAATTSREARQSGPGRRAGFGSRGDFDEGRAKASLVGDTAPKSVETRGHKSKRACNTIAELKLLGRERNSSIGKIEPESPGEVEDHSQRIREKAYEIWMQEGRPEGRELHHWDMATQQIFQD